MLSKQEARIVAFRWRLEQSLDKCIERDCGRRGDSRSFDIGYYLDEERSNFCFVVRIKVFDSGEVAVGKDKRKRVVPEYTRKK